MIRKSQAPETGEYYANEIGTENCPETGQTEALATKLLSAILLKKVRGFGKIGLENFWLAEKIQAETTQFGWHYIWAGF